MAVVEELVTEIPGADVGRIQSRRGTNNLIPGSRPRLAERLLYINALPLSPIFTILNYCYIHIYPHTALSLRTWHARYDMRDCRRGRRLRTSSPTLKPNKQFKHLLRMFTAAHCKAAGSTVQQLKAMSGTREHTTVVQMWTWDCIPVVCALAPGQECAIQSYIVRCVGGLKGATIQHFIDYDRTNRTNMVSIDTNLSSKELSIIDPVTPAKLTSLAPQIGSSNQLSWYLCEQ